MSLDKFVVYPAVFELETAEGFENVYNVTFPDVQGAITYGTGIKESMFHASEALGLILYDFEEYPKASTLEEIQQKYPNDTVHLIGVDLEEFAKGVTEVIPKVKKNTTIPLNLAKEAEELGLNFSAVLTRALKKEIQAIKNA